MSQNTIKKGQDALGITMCEVNKLSIELVNTQEELNKVLYSF